MLNKYILLCFRFIYEFSYIYFIIPITLINSPNTIYKKVVITILCLVCYKFQKFPYNTKEVEDPLCFLSSAELCQNGHGLAILLILLVSQTCRSASIKLLSS